MRWLALIVLLAAGCSGGAVRSTDTPKIVGPLSDAAFAFCHDTDEPVSLSEADQAELCPLLEDAEPGACPGLRLACDGPGDTDVGPPSSGGCSEDVGDPRAPEAPAVPPASSPVEGAAMAIGEVFRWAIAFGIALLVFGLSIFAIRALLGWLRREPTAAPVEEALPVEVAHVEVPDADALPDAPSGDLLSAARRSIDGGEYRDGVLLCRGAALQALGERGALRLHASRTDREYARSLKRSDPEGHRALRRIVRAVEAVRWGGQAITEEQAKAALEAAGRILGLLLVGLMLLVASPAEAAPREDYGLDGSAGLKSLFEQNGFEARWRLRGLDSVDAETGVLVLDTGTVVLSLDQQASLRAWVIDGGVLVVAGSLEGVPELGHLVRTDGSSLYASRSARDHGLVPPIPFGDGIVGYEDSYGTPWVIASQADDDSVVLVQALSLGEGIVIGLADGRYLTNAAFISRSNAAFVGTMLYVAESMGHIALDERPVVEIATIGGGGAASNTPLASLANARLLPLVVQILGIVVLIGLWRGWPFGPPRDPPEEGRVRFADHAIALGRRFARAGASRYAASRVAQLCLARMGPVALQAAAERHGYRPAAARDLVARVQAIADEPDGPDARSDRLLVEELWRVTNP